MHSHLSTSIKPKTLKKREGNKRDLLIFEPRADVAQLLVDTEALLLLVVAVAYVADEDREPPHPRERHLLVPRLPPPPTPPLEKPQIRLPPREIWHRIGGAKPRGAAEWIGTSARVDGAGRRMEAVLIRWRRSSEVDGGEERLICLPVCPGGGACAGLGGAFSLVSGRFIASAKEEEKNWRGWSG